MNRIKESSYRKFVRRQEKNDYKQLLALSKYEDMMSVYLEQATISKKYQHTAAKAKQTSYHPRQLSVSNSFRETYGRSNLSNQTASPIPQNKHADPLEYKFLTPNPKPIWVRKQSSFLEEEIKLSNFPQFERRIFPNVNIERELSQISKTTPLSTKQRHIQFSLPIFENKPKLPQRVNKRTNKQSQLQKSFRIELNEELLRLLKMLLKNIANQPNKTYFQISIEQFKRYLCKVFPSNVVDKVLIIDLALKLLEFFEIGLKIDFQVYQEFITKINNLWQEDHLFLAFYLMDFNTDGVICPTDIFTLLKQSTNNSMCLQDFKILSRVMIEKLRSQHKEIETPIYPELYHAKVLTCQLYIRVSRKISSIMVPKSAKKDTVYHLGFNGLAHRPEERLKEIEQQKRQNNNLRKFSQNGEFSPSMLGEIFDNIEVCSINYCTFKQIYCTTTPFFLLEIIQVLTLYQMPDIKYSLTTDDLLESSKL